MELIQKDIALEETKAQIEDILNKFQFISENQKNIVNLL
jgi:hypothetical protein